ncbi:pyrimidodiazepine synthase [Ixodes scapularis]|uniref:pyrimidodiazepine synthase n=1 Tax=Ixodes scapularis TaxID=6945 RepID=UPI001A9FF2C2|nr:pyrimidodiazepine synthase [Ixodes scapularis]
MSTEIYRTGMNCPPLEPGVLRIYGTKTCPYVQRCLLLLHAKDISYEFIYVDLEKKPEWLFKLNSVGKVPILQQDSKVLYESMVLFEYLDETYGAENSLIPADPYCKAKDKLFIDVVTNAFMPALKIMYKSENRKDIWMEQTRNFRRFEAELKERNTNFFAGDVPGFADYMIWPFFCIAFCAPVIFKDLKAPSSEDFPRLVQWVEAMKKNKAVLETQLDKHIIDYWSRATNEMPGVVVR